MSAVNLKKACSNILSQLGDLVEQISGSDFVKPAETLSFSTIGQFTFTRVHGTGDDMFPRVQ